MNIFAEEEGGASVRRTPLLPLHAKEKASVMFRGLCAYCSMILNDCLIPPPVRMIVLREKLLSVAVFSIGPNTVGVKAIVKS